MIQQGLCTIFKNNVLSALENFAVGTSYTYKIALYNASADLGPTTLVYTTVNEITGTGYIAGGKVLTIIPPTADQAANTAYVSFANVTWNPAVFTARGALIYNSTTNAAVAVLDFGSNKTATTSFTVTFPAATSTAAIIRFS
jgi:hypothetical protein